MAGLWEHSQWWMTWLVRTSMQASVLVVLVLAAQWALRRWLSARWRHALWLLVLVRLALPAAPQAPWSIHNVLSAPKAPPAETPRLSEAPRERAAAPVAAQAQAPPPMRAPKPRGRRTASGCRTCSERSPSHGRLVCWC
jgi:hypothetical protein